ncbi:MAG: metal ABC transporter permease, partial [Rickettsiales bacterium]
ADLIWIYGGGSAALLAMMLIWRSLLASVVHAEMAAAEGIAIERTRLLFTLLLATVIALAMKIVGILLIVSLLIIPAAAARPFARSPEQMALRAAIFGVVSVVAGLGASLQIDSASGPSIVIAAFALFLLARAAVWLKDSLVRRTMSN